MYSVELTQNPQLKMKLLVFLWRVAKMRSRGGVFQLLLPIHLLYWFYSQVMCAVELPIGVVSDGPLVIWHGAGLVVNPGVRLGRGVVLRNGVVIGNDGQSDNCPRIGDSVEIGANAVIVGDITVGDGALVGPNTFVNFNVPSGAKVISTSVIK